MRYCPFTMDKINLPQDGRITGSRNRCIDRTTFWNLSCSDGKILPVDLTFCTHFGEQGTAYTVFGRIRSPVVSRSSRLMQR